MTSSLLFAILCIVFIAAPLALVVLISLCRVAADADKRIEQLRKE